MDGNSIRDGVALLHAGIDTLLSGDLSALPGPEVTALLVEIEQVRRRFAALDHRLVSEIESRRLAGEYARSSTTELLVTTLRITPGEARTRVAQAADLGPRRTLQGEPLPPLLPATSAAVSDGEISTAHVQVITGCLDHVPPTLSADAVETVEAMLVQAARHEHPGQLRRTAALLLARLDPDGAEPRTDELERHRELTLGRGPDGSGRLHGRLTPEATAVWDAILDTLSAPAPSEDGEPDPRTAGQRRHDALLDAGHRLLRSGTLPTTGGIPVTILVRTTPADLAAANGVCLTSRGDLLHTRNLITMAGDAEIIPVILANPAATNTDGNGGGSAVLALGRTQRLASRAQRLALTARDGGCSFPGCDRPPAWTEVHHVNPWQDGGTTDLNNLCLLCRFHHREFKHRGWRVEMSDGIPHWIPPPWIDPTRRPRRNHTHHPPDLDFGTTLGSQPGRASPAA